VTSDCKRANARRIAGQSVVCALVIAALTGCAINCDRNPDVPPVEYRDGVTEGGFYSSSLGLGGPFLEFPPGRTYRIFHDLGGPPRRVETRLAYSEACGNTERGVERSAESAGNQVSLEQPTAPDYFDLRNDTCSDVCLWVGASHPILESEPSPEEPDATDVEPTPSDGG
jgi:hypothetical protein